MKAASQAMAPGRGAGRQPIERRAARFGSETSAAAIAVEVPVALVYNSISHAVMMASPSDLEDFALGFSLSEGIVETAAEVRAVEAREVAGGMEIAIEITPRRFETLKDRRRSLVGRTGCGICGVDALSEAVRLVAPVPGTRPVSRAAIDRALTALRAHQPLNADVHALHAAAWADASGEIETAREDVGRHNALDKLIGARAAGALGFDAGFLVLTSRCSVEMVQKAARMGVTVVVAVSAPTTLAIDIADAAGMMLVASARPDGGGGVFTHPEFLA